MNWLLLLFAAKHIECFTQYGICSEKYMSVLSQFQGYPLYWRLPTKQVQSQFQVYPEVAEINLFRRLPNTLVANIRQRRPFGVVRNNIVDEDGKVLGVADKKTVLPVLDGEFNKVMLNIMSKVASLTSLPIRGTVQDSYLIVKVGDSINIWFDTQKKEDNWYSPLQSILSRSKIDGKIPRKIDLRFSNPVVTY